MTIDYSKLKGRITEKFDTQQKFAEALGISERVLSDKLNNKTFWKQVEIDKSLNLLEINSEDIGVYFFNKKVQIKWPFIERNQNGKENDS